MGSLPTTLDADRAQLLESVLESVRTPRDVRRLIGTFAELEAAVRGEVDPVDVLAYSWIATKAPGLRDAMARHFDRLVSDPSQSEMLRRLHERRGRDDADPTPEGELGTVADGFGPLLRLMFPRFDRRRARLAGDRIGFRRNLVRLLYLDDPPGMTRRAEVEALWREANGGDIAERLRGLAEEGWLRGLIARLSDLLPGLPEDGGAAFWPALSGTLLRREDWARGHDEGRATADDAIELLMSAGREGAGARERARRALASLADQGDLLVVPSVLRRHLHSHGLTAGGGVSAGDEVLDQAETAALRDEQAPLYRRAVLDGTVLRRLPDVDALVLLLNAGLWDPELRTSLTDQLDSPEAIATLASLLVPEGWSVEHATLHELLDVPVVAERLAGSPAPRRRVRCQPSRGSRTRSSACGDVWPIRGRAPATSHREARAGTSGSGAHGNLLEPARS